MVSYASSGFLIGRGVGNEEENFSFNV